MKKLTAGIFATILGLTAVDAFAAAAGTPVASTNYVQGAIQSLNSTKDNGTAPIAGVTMTAGKITAVTPADMSAYALKADVTTSLGDYVTTKTYTDGQAAQDKALEDGLALKADKTDLKNWVETSTYTAGQSAQDAKITALEEANAALNDTYVTEGELQASQQSQDTNISMTYATKATVEALENNKADKTDLKNWVLTETYTSGQSAQDTRIKALEDANAALDDTYAKDSDLKDWVLTETYEADQAAQNTEINTAKTNATNALNAATSATNVAGEAKTTAQEAENTANTAKSTADKALEDAATAKSDAATAKSDAATAKSDAEKAKTDAESAKSTAEANAADIVTIKAEQTTQNNAIDALEAAAGNYVKWENVVDSYGE